MKKVPFEYRRIDETFLAHLRGLLSAGQSAVLLGLRDQGKRYVLKRLKNALNGENNPSPVVWLEFPSDPKFEDSKALRCFIDQAVVDSVELSLPHEVSGEWLLGSLAYLAKVKKKPVALLGSNVDNLSRDHAQIFLREVRTLVQQLQLVAVLSGEENLRDLVHGEDSVFDCANQFVIQAFSEPLFLTCFEKTQRCLLAETEANGCKKMLFDYTGGSLTLARTVLMMLVEWRLRNGISMSQPIGLSELRGFLARDNRELLAHMYGFQDAKRIVEQSPEIWDQLEALKLGQDVVLSDIPRERPHPLVLAGLAIIDGNVLKIASPLVHQFVADYYTSTRMGDLYASTGKWERAFSYWENLPPDRKRRPCGAEDRQALGRSIRALGAAMQTLATSPEEVFAKLKSLRSWVRRGCYCLLGMPDTAFWCWDSQSDRWKPTEPEEPSAEVESRCLTLLRSLGNPQVLRPGVQQLAEPHKRHAAVAVLPAIDPKHRKAVVISDFLNPNSVSKERGEFLRELLEHFWSSYHHLIVGEVRLRTRQRYLEVAIKLFRLLGEGVLNPLTAFGEAYRGLHELGYHKVMFSLVDSQRQRIRGVANFPEASDPESDLALNTDYSLAETDKDIQPYVVITQKPYPVPDPKNDALANQNLAAKAETGPFVVIPMLRQDGEAVGTIHIERSDRQLLSLDEIEHLIEMGRVLAEIIEQSERINTLQLALDRSCDGVALFDLQSRVRYANTHAARLLGVKNGWCRPGSTQSPSDTGQNLIGNRLERVLGKATRSFSFSGNRGADEDWQNVALDFEPIPDWRIESRPGDSAKSDDKASTLSQSMGALLQIRNFTDEAKLFAALRDASDKAAENTSTVDTLLKTFEVFGHRKVRLYRIHPSEPNVLTSYRTLGSEEPFKSRFDAGANSRSRDDPNRAELWRCIDEMRPVVLHWPQTDRGREDSFLTEKGVEVIVVRHPAFQNSWKKLGDYWIDLPVRGHGGTIWGKITVDCDKDVTPEHLEFLDLFAGMFGVLLEMLERREGLLQEAAQRALAIAAHNIRTLLAGLDGIERDYAEAAPGNAEVAELNEIVKEAIGRSMVVYRRILETFRVPKPRYQCIRLRDLIERVLRNVGTDGKGQAPECDLSQLEEVSFEGDGDLLFTALAEMIRNSIDMAIPERPLRLRLTGRTEENGAAPRIVIEIQDNGPGVPPVVQGRLFQPFATARATNQGHGLGLYHAHRIVQAHRGQIWLKTTSDAGTTFAIDLPKAPESPNHE